MVDTHSPTGRFGGVRALEKRLRGRSEVIAHNKEAVAQTLVDIASANLTDVISWDDKGDVKVKASSDIPESAAAAIKRIRVTRSKSGNPTLELEMHDKIGSLKVLAKSAGLLEPIGQESDAPTVIGIKMVGPDIVTTEYEEVKSD